MADNTKLVRIRPYNPRAGHKVRSYTIRGIKFLETRGWYRVPADLADYLESLHQESTDPYSKPVFDVCDDNEAMAMQDRERKAQEKAKAEEAHEVSAARTVTTADLPASKPKTAVKPKRGKGRGRKPASDD